MDKWRSSSSSSRQRGGSSQAINDIFEDTLLPPTLRSSSATPSPAIASKKSKKWSIDGIFKKRAKLLDAANSSSSSSNSLHQLTRKERPRRRKGKSTTTTTTTVEATTDVALLYTAIANNNNNNNEEEEESYSNKVDSNYLHAMDQPRTNSRSCSDNGSDNPANRRVRKDKVKARVEAKRDQLCDSEEGSCSEDRSKVMFSSDSAGSNGKRRSRASRTERYMKRIGTNGVVNGRSSGAGCINIAHYHSDLTKDEDRLIRPIETVPRSGAVVQQPSGVGNGELYTRPYLDNGVPVINDNFYRTDVGVNPLVQQTLQYFSEFDRNMAMQQQQQQLPTTRNSKVYPNHHRHTQYPNHHNHYNHHHQHRHTKSYDDQPAHLDEERLSSVTPPKPPSRDHRSRILTNGTSLQKYQQMLHHMQRNQQDYNKENRNNVGYYGKVNPRPPSAGYSPEVRSINGNNEALELNSPDSMWSTMMMAGKVSPQQNRSHSQNSQIERRTPLRESHDTSVIRGGGSVSSPVASNPDAYVKSKIVDSPSPQRLNPACVNGSIRYDDENNAVDRMSERRSSKNLEEALCELEAIYNSLQLGDEELLDRADKRTMEEFLYKGFTASPDCLDGCDDSMAERRKTWADSALASYSNNKDEPDRLLRDDMAYRRIHAKSNRPASVQDHQQSSISYLMTSPIPTSTRDAVDPSRRKPSRRKEPDVTLDDVVYRSLHYANNTLKVVEPQPPFGIPLGPIATATESDYLHTDASMSERARSPYIPNKEPDIVTDDLAFRNLRKDAQPSSISSRQASPSFHTPMSDTPSPLPFSLKKRQQRATKSLSANLYGMINRSPRSPMQDLDNDDMFSVTTDSTLDDYFNEVPRSSGNRRISDPEVPISENWQRLGVDANGGKMRVTDLDLCQNRSDGESNGERSPRTDVDLEHRAASDKGVNGSSNGLSSCHIDRASAPPLPVRNVAPVNEQDLSVYKKLCQDLENLVQMTRGIEDVPVKSEPVVVKSHSPLVKETPTSVAKPILLADTLSPAAVTFAPSGNSSVSSTHRHSGSRVTKSSMNSEVTSEEKKPQKVERKTPMEIGTATINREISNLLDSLKCLDEESSLTISSCVEKEGEVSRDVVDATVVEERAKEVTKESKCDLASSSTAAAAAADKSETLTIKEKEKSEKCKLRVEKIVESEKSKEENEEEERKDKVDEDIFFRNAQLAKLSGDWKESTPKSAVINRRTSSDNNNVGSSSHQHPWEGMTKCNHKYHSMPAKTSSLTLFRQYGSKKKSNRKSLCTIS